MVGSVSDQPGGTGETSVANWRRVVPWAWSLVLALMMLGPALAPGYVLSYDMVWVPDLALRPDVWGLGSGLPRAVPSDAVVALLDELVPGMLLQKVMLLAVLVLAGVGVTRLTDRSSLSGQLVALTIYQWNPFVAERLLIGHWPVLVGYAALPWVIEAAQQWRRSGRLPTRLWFLLPVASLSASAGLVTAVVLVAFSVTRTRSMLARRVGAVLTLLAAANAPWVVSGLLHASSTLTDPDGARSFALRGEGSLPAPLAALGLGGIWNAEVVPASRTGPLAWVALVLVLALVATGLCEWLRRAGPRDVYAFACCWAIGWGTGVLTWALPDQTAWLVANVPGAGIVRDGARMLALGAPLLAVAGGYGAARLLSWLPGAARPATALALVLLPVATLPDAANGLSGRLTATQYPDDYSRVRMAIERVRTGADEGDVLLLPLSSYRQPAWNDGRKVLDPVGRYLTPDFVASDDLYVSGLRIAGEDARARAAARVLEQPTPTVRADGLAQLGIGFVVTEQDAGPAPTVTGRVLARGDDLVVQQVADVAPAAVPTSWLWAMTAAWLAFAALVLGGVTNAIRGVLRRHRGRANK